MLVLVLVLVPMSLLVPMPVLVLMSPSVPVSGSELVLVLVPLLMSVPVVAPVPAMVLELCWRPIHLTSYLIVTLFTSVFEMKAYGLLFLFASRPGPNFRLCDEGL